MIAVDSAALHVHPLLCTPRTTALLLLGDGHDRGRIWPPVRLGSRPVAHPGEVSLGTLRPPSYLRGFFYFHSESSGRWVGMNFREQWSTNI